MVDTISIKKLHKLILKSFNFNKKNNTIKIFNKEIFNYLKDKKTKTMLWENHSIINKNDIDNYVQDLLINKKPKIIHPFLLLLSWNKIKVYFRKKICVSTKCYELVPKDDLIHFTFYSREIFKIITYILSNKNILNYFPDIYSYILSDSGLTINPFYINFNSETFRTINFKIHLNKKNFISIIIKNNSKQFYIDKNNLIEFYIKNNSLPIIYNLDKQDMNNIIPLIYKEISFSISKYSISDSIKFYLINFDNLSPYITNFIIDNHFNNFIQLSDIKQFFDFYSMKSFIVYIKNLIKSNIFLDSEIIIHSDFLKSTVNQSGLDKIFMRIDDTFFFKLNIASQICSTYSNIKSKYLSLLTDILQNNHSNFDLLLENRNELYDELHAISPINDIIQQQNFIFSQFIFDENILQKINSHLHLDIHPKYPFLVKKIGNIISKDTFKRISKSDYSESEETSSYICNYRFIKPHEWQLLQNFILSKDTKNYIHKNITLNL